VAGFDGQRWVEIVMPGGRPFIKRPTAVPGKTNSLPELGMPTEMYDTTLSAPIFRVPGSFPTSWVDISGAAA